MSSVLTEEQRAFRDVMRSFVDEQVRPTRRARPRSDYPQESFDACVKMDLPAMQVPRPRRRRGGHGHPGDMIEQLARGCAETIRQSRS